MVIVEIGGTVGDIESLPFLEAIRQMRNEEGREHVAFVHVTLVPFLDSVGELKTKTTQHSVNVLRGIGIEPDVLVLRSNRPLTERRAREDRALRRHPDRRGHLRGRRAGHLHGAAGPGRRGLRRRWSAAGSASTAGPADLAEWRELVRRLTACEGRVRIALVGKYVQLHDAYLSRDRGAQARVHPPRASSSRSTGSTPRHPDLESSAWPTPTASSSPAASAAAASRARSPAARFAREHGVPYLGICLGMQIAVVEFARHVCGMDGANSERVRPRDARTR